MGYYEPKRITDMEIRLVFEKPKINVELSEKDLREMKMVYRYYVCSKPLTGTGIEDTFQKICATIKTIDDNHSRIK